MAAPGHGRRSTCRADAISGRPQGATMRHHNTLGIKMMTERPFDATRFLGGPAGGRINVVPLRVARDLARGARFLDDRASRDGDVSQAGTLRAGESVESCRECG